MTDNSHGGSPKSSGQLFINEQYLSVRKIGEGGFGVVWKAYDFSLRNFVAIKELLSTYTEPRFIEMFYKEALIAKNIVHDNIVRVQHFWRGSNGSYYLLMDYVRGNDLEHLIKRCNELQTRLPWELSVLICSGVLKAIDYANRLAKDPITGKPYGIVYRDISPGNVLISFEGNVKVSDFGIAKTADELSNTSQKRIVTGKYAYMSPEQMRGDADIDHRSDIYSIGLVLYEMLTGKPLHTGTNEEIKKQVLDDRFDPALLADIKIPGELVDIVAKSLERRKEDRYDKAIEMFRDIRRLLKGKETEELTVDLADFIAKVLADELKAESQSTDAVKRLTIQDIRANEEVNKIACKDFIVGAPQPHETAERQPAPSNARTEDIQIDASAPATEETVKVIEVDEPSVKPEEKGKTVFEEVGDWLVNRFKVYRKRLIRLGAALVVASLLFAVADVFLQITPMGKTAYSRIYPPDVVIVTVPAGATVSVKSRDGKVVVNEANSAQPIELRDIVPRTYIISAVKEGFKPVERVVRIEPPVKGSIRDRQQKIEIAFDFTLQINSEPQGADVFIDGNKTRTTPYKSEFTAGEHTVKLSMPGYEDLGALAKEAREGQCNIDFTKSSVAEMFSGVDAKYWAWQIVNGANGPVFSLTGNLFKKITINSNPQNILVHVHNESQPRGKTPVTFPLRTGEYKVSFIDPDGKFEQAERTIKIDQNTPSTISVSLNRWVVCKVRSKENKDESFITVLKINGNGLNISREISTAKPVRLALPMGIYKFTFAGENGFKPLIFKNVNIAEKSLIMGDLEYENSRLKVTVRDEETDRPLSDAYIWIHNQLVGKTDPSGVWENTVKQHSPATIRVVVKGYKEQSFPKDFDRGENYDISAKLTAEKPQIEISTKTVGMPLPPQKKPAAAAAPAQAKPFTRLPPAAESRSTAAEAPAPSEARKDVIVCEYCKKEYTVTGSRKPRFCTNCGRPFRQ